MGWSDGVQTLDDGWVDAGWATSASDFTATELRRGNDGGGGCWLKWHGNGALCLGLMVGYCLLWFLFGWEFVVKKGFVLFLNLG